MVVNIIIFRVETNEKISDQDESYYGLLDEKILRPTTKNDVLLLTRIFGCKENPIFFRAPRELLEFLDHLMDKNSEEFQYYRDVIKMRFFISYSAEEEDSDSGRYVAVCLLRPDVHSKFEIAVVVDPKAKNLQNNWREVFKKVGIKRYYSMIEAVQLNNGNSEIFASIYYAQIVQNLNFEEINDKTIITLNLFSPPKEEYVHAFETILEIIQCVIKTLLEQNEEKQFGWKMIDPDSQLEIVQFVRFIVDFEENRKKKALFMRCNTTTDRIVFDKSIPLTDEQIRNRPGYRPAEEEPQRYKNFDIEI